MIKQNIPFILIFLFLSKVGYTLESPRRIGKTALNSWEHHRKLALNETPYEASKSYPDFSSVGALVSTDGLIGTATLISPKLAVSSAHIVKNSFKDHPDPKDWTFTLADDFERATQETKHKISSFKIHPTWIIRQTSNLPLGDGDLLGVDLVLVSLEKAVVGIKPARLPFLNQELIGLNLFHIGFGSLVDGVGGEVDSSNSKKYAGRNILDRSIESIPVEGLREEEWGGILAFDFDSHLNDSNALGADQPIIDNLGTGTSSPFPVSLESSTAVGDSGAPCFLRTENAWRVHGVVSYGSDDSTYGDVTIFTRLLSHMSWLRESLPSWSNAQMVGIGNWRKYDWFGAFLPYENGWNFHYEFGWFYSTAQSDDEVWFWIDGMNWLWTSFVYYPYLYSNELKGWIYVDPDQSRFSNFTYFSYDSYSWSSLQSNQ